MSGRSHFEVSGFQLRGMKRDTTDRQRQEVREAQHVEIGLVDRIDRLDHPFRDQRLEEGMCQVITIRKRESEPGRRHRHRRAATRPMIAILSIRPTPHQAANTNINCQQNGLKYQVVPGG